jgi:hypothetical protein
MLARRGAARRSGGSGRLDAAMTVELGHDPFAPLAVAALATTRIELQREQVADIRRFPHLFEVFATG